MSPELSDPPTEAELIDEIRRLDTLMNTIAAQRTAAIRAFDIARTSSGAAEPELLDRGIAAEIGLAVKVSPTMARTQLRIARTLDNGHPRIRELYAAGQLSEFKVATIISATTSLSREQRAAIDEELAERHVEDLGVGRIRSLVRRLAAQEAPESFEQRCRAARARRYAHVRPATNGMAYMSAYLPMEQAVACYGALYRAANNTMVSPEPLYRTRAQLMADTLVERLTGQAVADDIAAEVQVLVPLEALLDPTSRVPAEIPGYGPVPADRILGGNGCKAIRRLLTREGIIIGGDTRRRCFTGALATFLHARDGNRCREPYCDAPARHLDHIHRWADGGTTTFDNGRGLCAFHNQIREIDRRWHVATAGRKIVTTTPTGHTYVSDLTAMAQRPRAQRMRKRRDSADSVA